MWRPSATKTQFKIQDRPTWNRQPSQVAALAAPQEGIPAKEPSCYTETVKFQTQDNQILELHSEVDEASAKQSTSPLLQPTATGSCLPSCTASAFTKNWRGLHITKLHKSSPICLQFELLLPVPDCTAQHQHTLLPVCAETACAMVTFFWKAFNTD